MSKRIQGLLQDVYMSDLVGLVAQQYFMEVSRKAASTLVQMCIPVYTSLCTTNGTSHHADLQSKGLRYAHPLPSVQLSTAMSITISKVSYQHNILITTFAQICAGMQAFNLFVVIQCWYFTALLHRVLTLTIPINYNIVWQLRGRCVIRDQSVRRIVICIERKLLWIWFSHTRENRSHLCHRKGRIYLKSRQF